MCVIVRCDKCYKLIDLDKDNWKYEENEIVCEEC